MWLDLAIAMSCGGGGLVCGWIMHAIGGFGNRAFVKQAAASINQGEVQTHLTDERIMEVAGRLKSYAASMAANVDEHQTKVQAVSNTLIASTDNSSEAVVQVVNQLITANEAMQTQLRQAQDQIHEQAEQIQSAEQRATTDALTRVSNRGAFDKHLEHRHSLGPGKAGTLALLDVDHFKKFNDVYGHRAGDEVLRVVANILHARLRGYGMVARYGGEEFVTILDGCPVEQAKDLIEAARIAISEREIIFEDKRLRVTASVGVAGLVRHDSPERWLQRADDAMYQSKEQGRDCGHWMDGENAIRIELSKQTKSQPTERKKATSVPAIESATQGEDGSDSDGLPPLDLDGASKSVQESVKPDPSAFSHLPDRESLRACFGELRGRTQSTVSIFVIAIRCKETANKLSMRSLLQIVRATLRSVDRIGREDNSTLLVCMPSMDEETAYERGKQICRSAQAIGLGSTDPQDHQISIGIAEAAPHEEFDDVVSRAVDFSDQQSGDGMDPICIAGQPASA